MVSPRVRDSIMSEMGVKASSGRSSRFAKIWWKYFAKTDQSPSGCRFYSVNGTYMLLTS